MKIFFYDKPKESVNMKNIISVEILRENYPQVKENRSDMKGNRDPLNIFNDKNCEEKKQFLL